MILPLAEKSVKVKSGNITGKRGVLQARRRARTILFRRPVWQPQTFDRLAADDVRLDEFLQVLFINECVPHAIGVDDHARAFLAAVVAAGGVGAHLPCPGKAQRLEPSLEVAAQAGRAAAAARRTGGPLGAHVGAEKQLVTVIAHCVVRANVRPEGAARDRKSTRLNSSHVAISYAVFCLKKK